MCCIIIKKIMCHQISVILVKQIHCIIEKGSVGSGYDILVMAFPNPIKYQQKQIWFCGMTLLCLF